MVDVPDENETAPSGGIFSLFCVSSRKKADPYAIMAAPVPLGTLADGFSPDSPAAKFLYYQYKPEPPQPPPSPVPFLRPRFPESDLKTLAKVHEGEPEPLTGPASQRVADEHARDGWHPSNIHLFRANEAFCQSVFNDLWDARYGRSRVRSGQTGELLCWGDGDSYVDVLTADNNMIDGAELTARVREASQRMRTPKKERPTESGRRNLLGHPCGAKVHRAGSTYYKWIDTNVRGVEVDGSGVHPL